ncbi:hypothetical protein, partial [Actinoplanes auranticolor]
MKSGIRRLSLAGMGVATGAALALGPASAVLAQDDAGRADLRGTTACALTRTDTPVASCPGQSSGSLSGTLIVIFHGHLLWPWTPGGPLGGLLGSGQQPPATGGPTPAPTDPTTAPTPEPTTSEPTTAPTAAPTAEPTT